MVVLVPRGAADAALVTLRASGEQAAVIGEVVPAEGVQID
jgi:hydrogenase maturation factor